MTTLTNRLCTLALAAWIALIFLGQHSPSQARTSSTQRALPGLDTRRGLYIRADGTRVYKDPLPPKKRVFTYRRKDGKVVQTVTGARRPYVSKKRPARRPARRHSAKKRSSHRR